MSLPTEGKSLSANQSSSTYLNRWLRYNYFRFEKNKRPPYSNSTFSFNFGYVTAIGMLFCITRPSFIQIGPPTAEIWRHVDFSRWRPRPLNTTSGFILVDVTAFRRTKSIRKLIFDDISQLRYNYFRFWNTNVRHNGSLLQVSISTIST